MARPQPAGVRVFRCDTHQGRPRMAVRIFASIRPWNNSPRLAAIIREQKEKKLRIHYMGYPDSDDETVGPDRVRHVFGRGAGESARGRRSN